MKRQFKLGLICLLLATGMVMLSGIYGNGRQHEPSELKLEVATAVSSGRFIGMPFEFAAGQGPEELLQKEEAEALLVQYRREFVASVMGAGYETMEIWFRTDDLYPVRKSAALYAYYFPMTVYPQVPAQPERWDVLGHVCIDARTGLVWRDNMDGSYTLINVQDAPESLWDGWEKNGEGDFVPIGEMEENVHTGR